MVIVYEVRKKLRQRQHMEELRRRVGPARMVIEQTSSSKATGTAKASMLSIFHKSSSLTKPMDRLAAPNVQGGESSEEYVLRSVVLIESSGGGATENPDSSAQPSHSHTAVKEL